MAYDGFYANLSTRASVNEILNQADRIKNDLVPIAEGMDEARRVTQEALTSIDQSKEDAQNSARTATTAAVRAQESRDEAKRYADAATYKFQSVVTPSQSIPVGSFRDFNVVTTQWPTVFYQTRTTISEATDTILYDIEARIGTQVVYKSEAISGNLKDSIPFFSDVIGTLVLRITNRGRAPFTAVIFSTLSQVGNV
ncbi:particle protein [Pseudomonas phage SCYZ1]|nr:particle protein [Pseudomonas phage SCYZ1]